MFKQIIQCIVLSFVFLMPSAAFGAQPLPPSTSELAYVRTDGDQCDQLTISDINGNILQQFHWDALPGCSGPSWSPNGKYLAVSDPIMLFIDTGTGTVRVLNDSHSGWFADSPSWSRDGRYLAWHEQSGGDPANQIWKLLDVTDGTTETLFSLSDASIAPDEIRYVEMRKDGIYTTVSGQPAKKINLTEPIVCKYWIIWKGNQLLCEADGDIVLIDAVKATSLNLTHTPDLEESSPQWSSDGKQIVFETYDPNTQKTWLEIISNDGSGLRILTHPEGDSYDVLPQWSPDDQYILFERRSGYKGIGSNIFVMKPDGTGLRELSDKLTYGSWRPIPKSD